MSIENSHTISWRCYLALLGGVVVLGHVNVAVAQRARRQQQRQDQQTAKKLTPIQLQRQAQQLAQQLAQQERVVEGRMAAAKLMDQQLEGGKKLFEHRWKAGQALAAGGDGLGPAHNDVSCVACHIQGGVGGGGPIDKNVDLLSVAGRTTVNKRMKIHPGLMSDAGDPIDTIVLHKFSTDERYARVRTELTGSAVVRNATDSTRLVLQRALELDSLRPMRRRGVEMILSQRNTPALFGAGLIDSIPDLEIHRIAARQPGRTNGEISGRVGPVGKRQVGRFGWRGQTAHLADFVLDACANELGLHIPTRDQAINPQTPKYAPQGFDLDITQLQALVVYVASLPAPAQIVPKDNARAELTRQGYQVFRSVGCINCHIENVAHVPGLFSDLLLHDMGSGLGDPSPATMATRTVRVSKGSPIKSRSSGGGSYGGGGSTSGSLTGTAEVPIPTNANQEWQTPPLWGVRDSAPYLHDGRAATLMEAITLHGGESKQTIARFLARPVAERLALIAFLETLAAPSAEQPAQREVALAAVQAAAFAAVLKAAANAP